MNYYDILGVTNEATKDEIKSAFRSKARVLHPDVNKAPDAAEQFKELGKAYETLMDDGKRATYDRFGEDGLKNAGFDTGGPFAGGFGGLDDIINQMMEGMFGGQMGGGFSFNFGGRPDPNAPQRGEDLRLDIEVSFEEAVFGAPKEIKFDHMEQCGACSGTGAAKGSTPSTCSKCQGSGQVQSAIRTPLGSFMQIGTCPECRGAGQVNRNPCSDCRGEGSVRKERKIEIKIPAGIDDLSNMRLSGEGDAGCNGGPAGDLFVVVHVKPSDYFKRDGTEIYTKLEITPAQAALGDEITVRTLDGESQVQVPAGIQYGERVRIKGAGVPLLTRPSHRGDHVIIVSVKTPTNLSDEEKNLYRKLYELNTGKKPKKGLAWLPVFLLAILLSMVPCFAAKVPDNVQGQVNAAFPGTEFRFDGMVILPDGTLYMPLFPAKNLVQDRLEVKETISAGRKLNAKPDVVIFNNDFVLLKLLSDANGQRTFAQMADPPQAVRSGLLPQDILTPAGLVIPENMRGIKGNLSENRDPSLRAAAMGTGNKAGQGVAQLQNKSFYILTPRNKNIQVVQNGAAQAQYALAQTHLPLDIKLWDDKFLFVTSFGKKSLDIISIRDERVIKQIEFRTNPAEIVIDANKNLAYVSAPDSSDIYAVNLQTMTLVRQIKVSGMCEKLAISPDGTKLLYYDKKSRDIWAVELNNNYLLRDLGRFPNVSKIVYANGKVYVTGRTSNRLAIIDYASVGLIAEVEVAPKPVDMLLYGNNLFILCAQNNEIQVFDTLTDRVTDDLHLNSGGFSTGIFGVNGTELGIVTDVVSPVFTVINLKTKQLVKSGLLEIPVGSMAAGAKVKRIDE